MKVSSHIFTASTTCHETTHFPCDFRTLCSKPPALEWYTTTLHEPSREQFSCQDRQETQQDTPNATHAQAPPKRQICNTKRVTKRAPNGMPDPKPSTKACTQRPSTVSKLSHFLRMHQECKLSGGYFWIVYLSETSLRSNFLQVWNILYLP